ncbi:hypothetical protein STEG23_024391, partial [Scotinomys teguina]
SGSSGHSFNPEVWRKVRTELQLACPVFQDLQGQQYHEPSDFKTKGSQQRNAAMIIQAFTAIEAGQSPSAWLVTIKY